ncbi:MAG: anaerobic ribonucleoside-triphosphate reductase activating protein [Oscillospiraceae bacterium]|nr:anaerobic ribonucleoside-triphosphate reductase activating protein [Oscillospiraceae bacterium]
MRFGGLARTSTIDFPGVLACVLFTVGCDLDCFYCHNRELIESEAPQLSEEEVMAFLNKRRGLLDGVVISGGEPTLMPDLAGFAYNVKEMGYKLKLDTNGQRPEVVRRLVEERLFDYYAVDLKASGNEYYSVCGGDRNKTEQTVDILNEAKAMFELRTTMYPGLDSQMLYELLKSAPTAPRHRLNVFRMPVKYKKADAERLALTALKAYEAKKVAERIKSERPDTEYIING